MQIAAGHVERADGLAGIFDDVAGAAGGADFADDGEDDVLRGAAGGKRAIDLHQHVFCRFLQEGLGGQHVFDFGGADAEGERAHGAVG